MKAIKSKRILNIAKGILLSKGENVVVYNTEKISPFYRYVIVCSAQSERRIEGIKENCVDLIYSFFKDVKNIEGKSNNKWVVIDAYDLIIHIFDQKERDRIEFDKIYEKCPHQEITDETEIPDTRERK